MDCRHLSIGIKNIFNLLNATQKYMKIQQKALINNHGYDPYFFLKDAYLSK